ncbi:Zn-ribbon domain-containing OB-fold protein [Sphingobium phenoxybenzoativorans]|uniref:Zn-ribbon domain-containing OB-fold protein n=1 Tax=Sphingobium phenoxybenzoativorans TaxID=1592790 RepID=UPI0008731657|nr:OB-fold domain-containing protein [Sphingobium phenoxybenzoativorans]
MITAATDTSPEAAAFQQAANESRLLFGQCSVCDKPHYYPRRICPFCSSAEVEWLQASGRGHIYSYSVVRKATPPYATAYVTLTEGVTMLTNLLTPDFDRLQIGDEVELLFVKGDDDQQSAFFRPIA